MQTKSISRIIVVIVAGLVAAIVVPICAVQWARVRRVDADARLKQDMLARGLSVEEIERLSTPEGLRQAQIAADNKVREAQIAADTQIKQRQFNADLMRDMLAHGLSVEEIERLITPRQPVLPVSRKARLARPDVLVLATAIESMVQTGEDTKAIAGLLTAFPGQQSGPQELKSREASQARPDALGLATAVASMVQTGEDTNAIATLLTVFLGRHHGLQDTAQESSPALPRWPTPGRIEECGPSNRPEPERKDVRDKRAESIVSAERRRE